MVGYVMATSPSCSSKKRNVSSRRSSSCKASLIKILCASCLILVLLFRSSPPTFITETTSEMTAAHGNPRTTTTTTNTNTDTTTTTTTNKNGAGTDVELNQHDSMMTRMTSENSKAETRIDDNKNSDNKNKKNALIWADMTAEEQEIALANVMPYLASFADKIRDKPRRKWATQGPCDTVMFGSKWGSHRLCDLKTKTTTTNTTKLSNNNNNQVDCNFISFGISTDYSFDIDLATKWNCRGFAADPTIVHPSQLVHPWVTFHNIAAQTLIPNEEAMTEYNSSKYWWVTSVPSLTRFLKLDRVNFLKMDCEGCEYSLARDILVEDPMFLHKVDQISFETHVSRQWLNSPEALYYYAMIFKLLHEAGLTLQASLVLGCSGVHEDTGCMKELVDMKFPCGREKKRGTSCHDYLFARL